MKTADFDFDLPNNLIAEQPVKVRDESRLLILGPSSKIEHRKFKDIISYLGQNDVLVFNNTKVFPARLLGRRKTGGKVEILLNHKIDDFCWETIGKNLQVGNEIQFDRSILSARVITKNGQIAIIKFNLKGEKFNTEVEKIGHVPLPPYIESKRKANHICYEKDKERYQTVYAKDSGSVAAPTAGLHFTQKLISALRKKGVQTIEITLHVGLGTFSPVEVENLEEHQIHKESFSIPTKAFNTLLSLKRSGYNIVAVGTTTARVLEDVFRDYPKISKIQKAKNGWTEIYIYPGYEFKFVDRLITNFHLPKSSLLFLVSALAGKDSIFQAYNEAIKHKYRFYSYGDAMFITK